MLIGKQLGRYHILDFIDRGGMGYVYRAEDIDIERQVAIKALMPHPDPQKTQDAIRLFRREMKAVAKLDHPNILPLYGYGEQKVDEDLIIYMVMPLRKEGNFERWLQKQGYSDRPLPLHYAMHFLRQAGEALQEAHDHHIIHLDVKPSNFLLRYNKARPDLPDLLLADFGLTKFMEESGTMSAAVRGTKAYMAPEQWRTTTTPVLATDQYALAIMAYQLLTGKMPFTGDEVQLMYQHLTISADAPCTINTYLPTDVDTVIMLALTKQPEERYPSIAAFINALQQAIDSYTDIPLVLAISESEAQNGVAYPLTLSNGRQVTIAVPAGVQNGQQIRLEGQGEKSRYSNHTGALVAMVLVKPKSENELAIERQLAGLTKDITSLKAEIGEHNQGIVDQIREISSTISQLPNVDVDSIVAQMQGVNTTLISLQGQRERQNSKKHLEELSKAVDNSSLLKVIHAYTIALATTTQKNLYPPYNNGKLVLNESLKDNTTGLWEVDQSFFFAKGAFRAKEREEIVLWTSAMNKSFDNFTYQVQMIVIEGFGGGLVFRETANKDRCYAFLIDCKGDYHLDVLMIDGEGILVCEGYAASFQKGLGQSNILSVVANEDKIDIYVNLQLVKSVQSGVFARGGIGVAVESDGSPTEVAFSNAKVWIS